MFNFQGSHEISDVYDGYLVSDDFTRLCGAFGFSQVEISSTRDFIVQSLDAFPDEEEAVANGIFYNLTQKG